MLAARLSIAGVPTGDRRSNLVAILCRHPEMRGFPPDLPRVGDRHASIPVEADAHLPRHILHERDDDEEGMILRGVRTSMPDGAKVAVVEHALPEGDQPPRTPRLAGWSRTTGQNWSAPTTSPPDLVPRA